VTKFLLSSYEDEEKAAICNEGGGLKCLNKCRVDEEEKRKRGKGGEEGEGRRRKKGLDTYGY
jgi:hypothetical protein